MAESTAVLIRIPCKYEKYYLSLEEVKDIDYTIIPVENFSTGELMNAYITISTTLDPISAGVLSGIILDTLKQVVFTIIKRFPKESNSEAPSEETHIKVSISVKTNRGHSYKAKNECTVNKNLDDNGICKLSTEMAKQLTDMLKKLL